MTSDPVTLTLPFLTWHGFYALLAQLLVITVALLAWQAHKHRKWTQPEQLAGLLIPLAWAFIPFWLFVLGATVWRLGQILYGVEVVSLASGSLGLGALIAALLGAPFVIYGTYLRHKTNRLEQEGHITDRINKAVEQLGADKIIERDGNKEPVPNIEVRMGAILSLERIAQDSTLYDKGRDHVRVMEILCAYVRHNSRAAEAKKYSDSSKPHAFYKKIPEPGIDVQTAISVIGRRNLKREEVALVPLRIEESWPNPSTPGEESEFHAQYATIRRRHRRNRQWINFVNVFTKYVKEYKGFQIDLRRCNLQKIDFRDLDFTRANFNHSKIDGANFKNTKLMGASFKHTSGVFSRFGESDLSLSVIEDSNFRGARMGEAVILGANLKKVNLRDSNLTNAVMDGSALQEVTFSEESGKTSPRSSPITKDQAESTFGFNGTLPREIKRPDHWLNNNDNFESEWCKWQANSENYTMPEKPK